MSRVLCACVAWFCASWASANNAWLLIDIDEDAQLDRGVRLAIARDLSARLAVILEVVPEQNADVRQRVQSRLQALDEQSLGSSARGRFFLSVGYQHYQLLELLMDAQSRLRCIQQARATQVEMHCWARLAGLYLSEERLELGLSTLRQRRMIPRDDDLPRLAQDPRVWYAQFGRGILRGIVTPYLGGDAGR